VHAEDFALRVIGRHRIPRDRLRMPIQQSSVKASCVTGKAFGDELDRQRYNRPWNF
jgi:hypothetical protein